jgi:hypothetical protein
MGKPSLANGMQEQKLHGDDIALCFDDRQSAMIRLQHVVQIHLRHRVKWTGRQRGLVLIQAMLRLHGI